MRIEKQCGQLCGQCGKLLEKQGNQACGKNVARFFADEY